MSLIDLEGVLNALVQRLEPLRDELGLRELGTYHGQFASERKNVIGRTPFIWLAYTGSPDFAEVNRRLTETMDFEVWLGDRDYSGRRGGEHHGGPGTFAMLRGVRELLLGHTVSGAGLVAMRRIDALAYSGASLYRVQLRMAGNVIR